MTRPDLPPTVARPTAEDHGSLPSLAGVLGVENICDIERGRSASEYGDDKTRLKSGDSSLVGVSRPGEAYLGFAGVVGELAFCLLGVTGSLTKPLSPLKFILGEKTSLR